MDDAAVVQEEQIPGLEHERACLALEAGGEGVERGSRLGISLSGFHEEQVESQQRVVTIPVENGSR